MTARQPTPLRVMTYNVRSCTVGQCAGDVERVAAVITAAAPDLVALQEVASGGAHVGGRNQPEVLASMLGWRVHYQPALKGAAGGSLGNALLSRLPSRLVAGGLLPQLQVGLVREPRGISWLAVTAGDREVHVLATHLGLTRRERRAQLDVLLGPAWLGDPRCAAPRLLCGDLNCRPGSLEHRRLESVLVDAALVAPPASGGATFPAWRPLVRLDHVLVSPDLRVVRTTIPHGPELRRASDHLPLVVDLELA